MTRYLRRAAASAVLVATTAAIGVVAPSADAAISTNSFCTNVASGSSGFNDIGNVATAQRRDIECLKASGITSGTGPSTYTPTGNVFRDSMATFVAKLVDTANVLELTTLASLPPNPPDAFTDDEATVHEANINRLAGADIVQGKTATTYGPNGPGNEVTRAQMATFLVRALEYLRNAPLPAAASAFDDDAGNVHEANIDKLAGIDVVDGTGTRTYAPNSPVSRAQMASFLVRSLAWLHSQGQIRALPSSTQTIVLSPAGPVTNETDSAAGGEVSFTASSITAGDVDLALFPCENVTSSQGATGFVDTTPNDSLADPGSDLVEADIVAVNGTNRAADTEAVSGVAATNGAITFTVDSPSPDCIVAVVWDDADDDDRLDLDANDRPSEHFGAAAVTFVPPAAATGPMDENVASNSDDANQFVGCELGGAPGAGAAPEQGPNAPSATDCGIFTYDSNDAFFVDANGNGAGDASEAVSLSAFETALSTGDDVAGSYQATAGNQSSFVLVDEAPGAPGGVTVATVDGDTLTVTFNELAGADSYRVFRNADAGPVGCPAFTTTGPDQYTLAGTVDGASDGDAGTTNVFTDSGLSASTRYCYAVTAVDEGDESAASATANGTTSADTVPPLALDTELTINQSQARLDGGDTIQICFDQDIADPADPLPLTADTETLQLRDGDGTVVTLSQGGNAIFRLGTVAPTPIVVGTGQGVCAASRVLDITVSGEPTVDEAGTVANLQLPATIVTAAEIEDTSGTQFQPGAAGNQDVVVDVEGDGTN